MAVRDETIRLHADIKKEFERLTNVTEYGVQKYTTAYILNKIADKFYKKPRTIENIVFNRTQLPEPTQIKFQL